MLSAISLNACLLNLMTFDFLCGAATTFFVAGGSSRTSFSSDLSESLLSLVD